MKEVQQPTSPISIQCVHSYWVTISMTTRWTMTTDAAFGQPWVEPMGDATPLWILKWIQPFATTFGSSMKVETLTIA